ncbi:hypothetical protein SIN01_27610 [Sporolactobacillus inulinus]|nr:hypothetical protein SIN01_27610 [Sporolactobacillus inulinus]
MVPTRFTLGEAENVFDRLNQHLSSKEFWTECIVFGGRNPRNELNAFLFKKIAK